MRVLLYILMVSCGWCLIACNQTAKGNNTSSILKDSAKFTTIQWEDSAINFGTKKMGDVVNITFRCTNTGTKPLYLVDVRPGCGCTLVDYTKQAIQPAEQGKIEAKFDTKKSYPGTVSKNIHVESNTFNNTGYLRFSGVIAANDSSAQKN